MVLSWMQVRRRPSRPARVSCFPRWVCLAMCWTGSRRTYRTCMARVMSSGFAAWPVRPIPKRCTSRRPSRPSRRRFCPAGTKSRSVRLRRRRMRRGGMAQTRVRRMSGRGSFFRRPTRPSNRVRRWKPLLRRLCRLSWNLCRRDARAFCLGCVRRRGRGRHRRMRCRSAVWRSCSSRRAATRCRRRLVARTSRRRYRCRPSLCRASRRARCVCVRATFARLSCWARATLGASISCRARDFMRSRCCRKPRCRSGTR